VRDTSSVITNAVLKLLPVTTAQPTDEPEAGSDLSPAAVLAAARSRWLSPAEILDAGPELERDDRIAEYKRGRTLLVRALIGRDGGRQCMWCGEALGGRLTIEHVVPRCAGGCDEPINLCLACGPCNTRRGGADAIDWYLQCRSDGMRPRARVLARRLQAVGLIADLYALRSLEAEHLSGS
jgi:hypothetical protein